MKDKSVKMRTITITGPFGIDDDGDEYGSPGNTEWIYSIDELKHHPDFTYAVEDAPRRLPTAPGSIISAWVTSFDDHTNQLLALKDPGATESWYAPGLPLEDRWVAPDQIGDDWVELVPAQ